MAFNSNTYHANRCSREAWAALAEARDIKERAAKGQAYIWEIPMIAGRVEIARSSMRLSLSFRRLRELQKRSK